MPLTLFIKDYNQKFTEALNIDSALKAQFYVLRRQLDLTSSIKRILASKYIL